MDLQDALADFSRETRATHWRQGKTFHQFWTWFGEREDHLLAAASAQERQWLEDQLEELRADCDDAGLAVPPEREHDPIP